MLEHCSVRASSARREGEEGEEGEEPEEEKALLAFLNDGGADELLDPYAEGAADDESDGAEAEHSLRPTHS